MRKQAKLADLCKHTHVLMLGMPSTWLHVKDSIRFILNTWSKDKHARYERQREREKREKERKRE